MTQEDQALAVRDYTNMLSKKVGVIVTAYFCIAEDMRRGRNIENQLLTLSTKVTELTEYLNDGMPLQALFSYLLDQKRKNQ